MFGVYLRVSTKSQKVDSQESEIRQWLTAHGHDPDKVAWYADVKTGRTLVRPEFERLQADIFAGKVKTVVCWKLDRLSRRLRDGINLLTDWLERDVRIVITTTQVDLAGPVGRLVASVLFSLAEIELQHRAERQAAGIRLAKERGIYKGRRAGTTRGKPSRARELRDRGLTIEEVAQAMAISRRTTQRYLAAT